MAFYQASSDRIEHGIANPVENGGFVENRLGAEAAFEERAVVSI